MIEDNTRPREDAAPKNQRLTAIRSGGIQHKTCSFDFCHGPTRAPLNQRLQAGHGMGRPPRRGPGKQGRRPPRTQETTDASTDESRQLRRRTDRLGSQAEPAIRDLFREALVTLWRERAVGFGGHSRHTLSRSGRDAVDLPLVFGNRSLQAACRFAVGAAGLFPHWAQNRSKNGVKRGRLGAKTGPKVSTTHLYAGKKGLPGDLLGRTLAMESHAAETFVNKSFRSSSEGSHSLQLTSSDCVQGGEGAHCQLTVSGFCECLSWGGNRKAASKDRLDSELVFGLKEFEGVLEGVVDQVGVDLGSRQVPVPEGSLDYEDVAGAGRWCMNRCKRAR